MASDALTPEAARMDMHHIRVSASQLLAYINQCETTERILAARLAEVTAQRDRMRPYADHTYFCAWRGQGPCDCGYAEAIAAERGKEQSNA